MTQPNDPPNPASPPPPPPVGAVPPPGTIPPPIPRQATTVEDARNLAAISHYFTCFIIVPLIIYLTKKGSDPFLDQEAKESLNFSLVGFIAHVAVSFAGFLPLGGFIRLAFAFAHLGIFAFQLVLGIQAGAKAKQGIGTKYPIQVKLIS